MRSPYSPGSIRAAIQAIMFGRLAAARGWMSVNSLAVSARDAHDHVVRRHGPAVPGHVGDLGRERPSVILVVQGRRPAVVGGHVVQQVRLVLRGEQVLGVAQVRDQGLGQVGERLEQAGEDSLVGRDDRLRGVHHVVVDRPGVGVDHDLDRVADVVQAAGQVPVRHGVRLERGVGRERLGVGVPIRRRVRVPDPDQAPIGADQVGVPVIGEERRELRERAPRATGGTGSGCRRWTGR